jgi:hypothetical protein
MVEISSMMSRDAGKWNHVLAVEVSEEEKSEERR